MTEIIDGVPAAGAGFGVQLPPSAIDPATYTEREEPLSLRHTRHSRRAKYSEKLTFEFTRDPALLHQYFRIYESECRVLNNNPDYKIAEQEYNNKSHIVVARMGNFCVGGARLTVSSPRQPQKLPVEINGFKLTDFFPHLEQKQMRYGELSRLVLLSEFRTGDIARQMFSHLYRKAVALQLDIGFAAAPLINIRAYKLNFLALGLNESKIHYDIHVPPYPGFEEVKDYLLSLVVDRSQFQGEDLEQLKDSEYPYKVEV